MSDRLLSDRLRGIGKAMGEEGHMLAGGFVLQGADEIDRLTTESSAKDAVIEAARAVLDGVEFVETNDFGTVQDKLIEELHEAVQELDSDSGKPSHD